MIDRDLSQFEGDSAWDSQLDFCSTGDSAPDFQLRSNALCALAHAGKSPVTLAPRLQYFCVNPAAVVSN
jgi:hypothetical protein